MMKIKGAKSPAIDRKGGYLSAPGGQISDKHVPLKLNITN